MMLDFIAPAPLLSPPLPDGGNGVFSGIDHSKGAKQLTRQRQPADTASAMA